MLNKIRPFKNLFSRRFRRDVQKVFQKVPTFKKKSQAISLKPHSFWVTPWAFLISNQIIEWSKLPSVIKRKFFNPTLFRHPKLTLIKSLRWSETQFSKRRWGSWHQFFSIDEGKEESPINILNTRRQPKKFCCAMASRRMSYILEKLAFTTIFDHEFFGIGLKSCKQ